MAHDIVDYFISQFKKLEQLKSENRACHFMQRPYRNAAVRFRSCSFSDFEKRRELAEKTGYNVFMFPSNEIPGCDLLSDSGTTTMTMEQWAELLKGDEAYGSNEGYFLLKDRIGEIFGSTWKQSDESENMFLFHQGRSAEYALFSTLEKILSNKKISSHGRDENLLPSIKKILNSKINALNHTDKPVFIIPSNSHFDTTGANIENSGMIPLNLPCKQHIDDDESFPFRGNMDAELLENLLESEQQRVPLIYITITNNAGGGQPVSLENIRTIAGIAEKFKIPFFFDACRFAENAWFIQRNEKGFSNRSITSIVHEMFTFADGFHISLKKDGLVNMGGAVVIRENSRISSLYPDLLPRLTDHQILTEGHPTYGGMAGRDLMAVAEGLNTVVTEKYLDYRITQVRRFGESMKKYNIPVMYPIGGHAVYIKVDDFFKDVENHDNDFKGVSLTSLLLIAGHRFCELGLYAFGKYRDREIPPWPRVNFVRAAVPRLAYEDQDLASSVESVKILYDNRDKIPGTDIVYGRGLPLRHFKSRFRFL